LISNRRKSRYLALEHSGQYKSRWLMEQKIVVRSLQLEDIAAVAELLSDTFYARNAWLGWVAPVFKLGIYQDLKSRFFNQTPRHTCLVGVQVSRGVPMIVGTVEVAIRPLVAWDTFGTSVPYISNLAVGRSYRRRGIGRQLLLACEPIVQHWQQNELYLHVKGENQAARGLYASLGYRHQREENPMWSWLLGQPQQLLLRKALPKIVDE
jgi:ribosomal protein S18 acetylase RimI-like enzyme